MSDYILGDAAFEQERRRLLGIEEVLDPITRDWLARAGLAPGRAEGWRCLEIGCGSGSMLRWMAGTVGPEGRVVGLDLDPCFVTGLDESNSELRRADVLEAELEAAHYDLAYARLLFIHLSRPLEVLRKLAAAVKPGGVVLLLDLDMTTMRAADAGHPRAADFDEHWRRVMQVWAEGGRMDPAVGGKLAGLMAEAGLAVEETDSLQTIFAGQSADARTYAETLANSAERTGLPDDTVAALTAILDDPAFTYHSDQINIVLGRRP